MIIVEEQNMSMVLVRLCEEAVYWPIEVRRGGNKMMDSPTPVAVEIRNPRDRVLDVVGRNNSLPAACAETLWILAGRNDVEWLKFYLPRAPDFSDDVEKKFWRAGYGPRLRRFGENTLLEPEDGVVENSCGTDQLKFVVNELKAIPNSRRAIMTLVNPEEDLEIAPVIFKDFPCNLTLSFMVRGGRLDLVVFCRSQDLIWGASGINWFEFGVMQELVANMIDIPVGTYYHVTNNLHVYDRHFKIVNNMAVLDEYPSTDWDDPGYGKMIDLKDVDKVLSAFFELEGTLRRQGGVLHDRDAAWMRFASIADHTLLGDLGYVTLAHMVHTFKADVLETVFMNKVKDEKMKKIYWERRKEVV